MSYDKYISILFFVNLISLNNDPVGLDWIGFGVADVFFYFFLH
jgi:hypothetical protein